MVKTFTISPIHPTTKNLELWNPHTGETQKMEVTKAEVAGQSVTTVALSIPVLSAVTFVGE